jgi:hypothetical protein
MTTMPRRQGAIYIELQRQRYKNLAYCLEIKVTRFGEFLLGLGQFSWYQPWRRGIVSGGEIEYLQGIGR